VDENRDVGAIRGQDDRQVMQRDGSGSSGDDELIPRISPACRANRSRVTRCCHDFGRRRRRQSGPYRTGFADL
jgi:hypothetical protein